MPFASRAWRLSLYNRQGQTILEEGSEDQIKALNSKSQTGEGPGVRTVYEQVKQEAIEACQ
ncbi:MAG: hypothetical protein WAM14_17960 [Candidatus Nitrosopolaris sp.]